MQDEKQAALEARVAAVMGEDNVSEALGRAGAIRSLMIASSRSLRTTAAAGA